MSKFEKLVLRLKSKPTDFSYSELSNILNHFGYKEENNGKSSGSRVAWIHSKTSHIIRLHKPHPKPILKHYQIILILDALNEEGFI